MKSFFGAFLLLVFSGLSAQDTVAVYFEYGSSQLEKTERIKLIEFSKKTSFREGDSIHFVGSTDSVGSLKANIKLSEKRANEVAKFMAPFIPTEIKIKSFAKGEKLGRVLSSNRKVSIILFYKILDPDDELKSSQVLEDTITYCHQVDYYLLHRASIRTIAKRKKEFIEITCFRNSIMPKAIHYTGSKSTKGKIVYTKVKWKNRNENSVALVPKKDFEKYKIFTRSLQPCTDTCSEKLIDDNLVKAVKCIQLDTVLMRKIEYKAIFLNNNFYKVRALQEHVNINDKYFYGCDKIPLKWRTKKFFNRNKYYYTKIPRWKMCGNNILREMDCCMHFQESDRCDKCISTFLDCLRGSGFLFDVEMGYNHLFQINELYAGIKGTAYAGFHEVMLGLYAMNKGPFYSTFTYNIDLIQFPYDIVNPFGGWKKSKWSNFGRIYFGTELRYLNHQSITTYFDQNVHLGFAHWGDKRIRFYAQYGIAYDYSHQNTYAPYSLFEIGATFNLVNFSVPY